MVSELQKSLLESGKYKGIPYNEIKIPHTLQYYPEINIPGNIKFINIIDNIFIGSLIQYKELFNKRDHNWVLVNVREKGELVEDFAYIFPLDDFGLRPDHKENMERAINFLLNYTGEKRVLVSCAAGMNRSASVILGYIMQKYDKSLYESMKYFEWKRQIKPSVQNIITIMQLANKVDIDFLKFYSLLYAKDFENYLGEFTRKHGELTASNVTVFSDFITDKTLSVADKKFILERYNKDLI